jgi:histone H3/H4
MAPAKKAAKKSPAKKSTKKTSKKTTKKSSPVKKATRTAKKATKKATRTAKKATKKATNAASGNVVVASKVKEAVKDADVRMSGDFPEALNAEIQEVIAKAVQRAKDNGRGTVRPSDL